MLERSFIETFKMFINPLLNNNKLLKTTSIYFFLDAIVSIGLIYLFKIIVDNINSGIDIKFYIFLGLVFLKLFIVYYFRALVVTFFPTIRGYLYDKYLHEYLKLNNNKTELYGSGKIIAIIEKSTLVWIDQLWVFFRDIIAGFLNIILSIFIVFGINLYYGIIVIILIILALILSIYVQNYNKKYRKERREFNLEISKKIVNFINSKFEILQNYKGKKEVDSIVGVLENNKVVNRKIIDNEVYFHLFMNLIIFGTRIFIVLLFILGYEKQIITMGEFVVMVSFTYILEKTLLGMTTMYTQFSNNLPDIEKIWEVFDGKSDMVGYEEGKDFEFKSGEINIKNLGFYYYEGKNIFNNFSLNIPGGKITAFVGNSGSGKSTLVKLIAGYISPQAGEIIIDGQKISEVSLKSYYKDIGYLTQEPSVFDGTIYDNLTYAIDRELSPGELDEVIKKAKCEFIYDLPNKEFSQIGERGVKLSGGQKQRLAIAKIMLKNPKIIILDEPTSALDSFSEEQITKALNNLFEGKTVIVVAHRLQTVKNAHIIHVFENGEIIESGKHDELVEKGGIYAKMLELQSGF